MRFAVLLAIWILLCSVAVRPLPHDTTGQKNQADGKTQHNGSVPSRSPSVVTSDSSKADSRSSKEEIQPKPIRITEVPRPDAWYKTYVLATIALLIVGTFGVYAAYRTLNAIQRQGVIMRDQLEAIKRQADIMERQERILADSTAIAERSANAALNASNVAVKEMQIAMERERPRISVKVKPLQLKDPSIHCVSYDVDFWCPTPAFIVEAWVHLGFDLGVSGKPSWWAGIPVDTHVRQTTLVNLYAEFQKPLTKETIAQIQTQEKVVYFCGRIIYRGVQLSPDEPAYKTTFRWRWNAADMSDDPEFGVDFSSWRRDGKPEDNQQT